MEEEEKGCMPRNVKCFKEESRIDLWVRELLWWLARGGGGVNRAQNFPPKKILGTDIEEEIKVPRVIGITCREHKLEVP